jgi:hypothetical protein
MKPGIIECAFNGVIADTPVQRTSPNTGRDWARFTVRCGETSVLVLCFGPAVEVAATLQIGDSVYAEGKHRDADMFTVIASTVQPLGKIGERKPKATRKTTAARMRSKSAVVNAPLGFDDQLPI